MENTSTKKVQRKITPAEVLIVSTPAGPVEIIVTRTSHLTITLPNEYALREEKREGRNANVASRK